MRARLFDTRARIKRLDVGIRDPQASIVSPSTRFCPSSGAPRVISGIGRALCAAFRARKRFVICASVVYIGGVLEGSLFSLWLHYTRRAIARQCHPTRCSRIQIVTASRNLSFLPGSWTANNGRVALFRAAFSTAAASLSLNEGTLSPTA